MIGVFTAGLLVGVFFGALAVSITGALAADRECRHGVTPGAWCSDCEGQEPF